MRVARLSNLRSCPWIIQFQSNTQLRKHSLTPLKPLYANETELMALSLPALRLFGYVISLFDEHETDRTWIRSQEVIECADLLPTQLASVQLELARSGLMWIRHGLKGTRYQLCRPEQRQRRDHLVRLSTIGKPRDSQTPTTSKAGEGWSVRREPPKNYSEPVSGSPTA